MDLQVIAGDLLEAPEKYICHQCNCMSSSAAHLALAVFQRFPYADIYSPRPRWSQPPPEQAPGQIVVCGNGNDQRFVINMLGQYYPGRPRFPGSQLDGTLARQEYFQTCLDRIILLPAIQAARVTNFVGDESIAFPWQIGCGAAGGDWVIYRHMIREFAEKVGIPVRVYRLPGA